VPRPEDRIVDADPHLRATLLTAERTLFDPDERARRRLDHQPAVLTYLAHRDLITASELAGRDRAIVGLVEDLEHVGRHHRHGRQLGARGRRAASRPITSAVMRGSNQAKDRSPRTRTGARREDRETRVIAKSGRIVKANVTAPRAG